MIGLNNTTLVYGVLDLIKREIEKNNREFLSTDTGVDPLGGTPSVILERLHPDDPDVLTGAKLYYESGFVVDIQLGLGMTDEEVEAALAKNQYDSNDNVPTGSEPDTLPDFNKLSAEEQDGVVNGGDGTDFHDHGVEITEVLPEDIKDRSHPDFEFYYKWRLSNLMVDVFDEGGVSVENFNIKLIYDHRGMLQATMVIRPPQDDL